MPSATVNVDVASNVHAIDPNIYGTAFASTAQLADLNIPLNRDGGNASDTYSFAQDATNHGSDWYFESIASGSGNGQGMDSFVSTTKAGGAKPSITLNLFDWAAKLGSNRSNLGSFSVAKYGAQQSTDPYNSIWGNGVHTNGANVTGNDPNDAYVANSPAAEQAWIQHLISSFGDSQHGGVPYYTLGNEPGLWNSTHRDIHPAGDTLPELLNRILSYASMIKALDPGAKILGPEEWGWTNYFISGADAAASNWGATYNGLNAEAWLLDQLRQHDAATGQRLLDYFTLHFYPQGGQFGNDVSTNMELLRNRSTRSLWDPNYVDESWIANTGINGGKVNLINLMKNWVTTYYPGTRLGISEYNWGAEGDMNGATTQADIWGIFGREGLDLADRWTTPAAGSPAYLAMKLFRNYDGNKSAFGDRSVAATVANPDQVDAFSAIRLSDGALTVLVVNKNLFDPANPTATTQVTVNLSNFAGGAAQEWQLAAINPSDQTKAAITQLADIPLNGTSFTVNVPQESVEMFVLKPVSQPKIVDNGTAGYSETGTWTTETVPAYGGNERYAISSGTGQNTATWQVAGLPAGFYQAQVSWHPYPNQAPNAPYAIYDGSTLLQKVTVNQTMPASGPMFGGVPFQSLGTFHITSGTLKVLLSNTGGGTYIVADAMREAFVPVSGTDLNWSATGDGITGPASVNVQSNFTINRTYTVSGAAAPGSFTITYYASPSSNPNQDLSKATLLGSETLSATADLAVGNHSGASPSFQFASGGSYYLLATLTSSSFAESDGANDTNDVAVTSQAVQVLGPIIVDNGDAGYSETGTWNTETVLSYGGTERYATSSGTGQNTATWQASGLTSGLYQVQATWHPYSNEATNAPYAIYDGTTLLQTVAVNQTQTASGPSFGGVPFQTLATVNVTSGTLKVVLSNTGNGSYVVADAVRILPAPVSSTDLNWSAPGDGITGPSTVNAQAPFTVSRTYSVSGAAAPAKFTISYYASTSSSTSQDLSQATLLGSETLSAAADLAVGNHSGTSPSLQLPNGGTYYLVARLTADSSWAESDAANDVNDVAVAPQPVQVSGPVIVDNGTAGYSETGAWATESVPSYGGTERYATSSGSGQNTATWQVTGLPAGLYQVQVTWHAFGNESTNAPYAIYDGTTLVQTVLVNQTVMPPGPSFGGVPFQTLATVNLTTGTLKVVVSNTGNGSYVVADAMRAAPVPVSNTDLTWSAAGDGITGPAAVNQQTGFTISRTYTISGAAAPSGFSIAYYASMSSNPKQDLSKATFLGKETVSAAADLAVGNHSGTSPAFQFTNGGDYTLFAVLNADNSFTESDAANDTNNLAISTQQTVVSGPVIVDNGDPTYSETGSWTTQADRNAYAGSDRYASASGAGSTTATWVVPGLASGTYAVEASWGPYYNQSTNAPYAIYDGATLVQVVTADQTKTPSGASAGGVPFQILAHVTINSGTLTVVLSNSGNSSYVIADALRVA
ncbi:MAG TPA: glycoside hydrolase family 44 protein [Gemmataceae bacterium]|nr:glycoside hydrolase family 44 protein [Gemmataceae bacterium]